MSNTSKKRTNKKIRIAVILGLAVLLIVSFIMSKQDTSIDPALVASVEVSDPAQHFKGNLESEVTLIEYSDFECPACKAAAPQISQLIDVYGDAFQLEYRHLPLTSIHPNAEAAAYAAEAAGMQGKFWEMHDVLFERQTEWSQSFNPTRFFRNYAEDLGLNADRLEFDMDSDLVQDIVENHLDEAKALRLPGTPSFVVNGESIAINDFIADYLLTEEELATIEETQAESAPQAHSGM